MNSTGPFLAVTLSYFVLLAVIGWWGNRQNKNLRDFFTMSGSAGAILAGLAYFSTQYSMSTFMGVPGSIYHVGYAGMSVSVPGIAFSMIIRRSSWAASSSVSDTATECSRWQTTSPTAMSRRDCAVFSPF